MRLVQLPLETQEAVQVIKKKIQTAPVLIFLDFNKSFLLETDTSKEGLGTVLSQKQDDRCYHPITFWSCSLTPSEKNYQVSHAEVEHHQTLQRVFGICAICGLNGQ